MKNNIFFTTYWHAICNKILRIVSYVRWYTENNTSDPIVTFFASEQKILGDCGLSISHNYHYLIKLVIYFEFLSNTLLQIGTHLQCNCVPNCNKLLQIGTHLQCNADSFQLLAKFKELSHILDDMPRTLVTEGNVICL